jgi:hypothetical protein
MNDHPTDAACGLTPAELRTLRALVAEIIPPSSEYGVPGADDERIFADLLTVVPPQHAAVCDSIRLLDDLAGGSFADQPPQSRRALAAHFRTAHSAFALTLTSLTARVYYRDDRVMRSIGMEVRPPFPRGFDLAEGDLRLLDPVRARGKIWRDAPPAPEEHDR